MQLLINKLHKDTFLELHVNLVLAIDMMSNIINGIALVLPLESVKIISFQDMDFVLAHVHSEVPQHCWVVNELLVELSLHCAFKNFESTEGYKL